MALDPEDAEQTPTLDPGEVIVIPSRSSEPKARMQVIYPDEEALQIIASVALELLDDGPVSGEFPKQDNGGDQDPQKRPGNVVEMTPEMAYRARVRRVRELRAQGRNQTQIIEILWGITPGGSGEYAKARDEFKSIMQQIAVEDAREA